jgi:hypothetical protein
MRHIARLTIPIDGMIIDEQRIIPHTPPARSDANNLSALLFFLVTNCAETRAPIPKLKSKNNIDGGC